MAQVADRPATSTRKHDLTWWSYPNTEGDTADLNLPLSADDKDWVLEPCVIATTTNITLSGLSTLQGVVLAAGDRILVTGQSTSTQNDIYLASNTGWTRSGDSLAPGLLIPVNRGSYEDTLWMVGNDVPPVRGTDAITFVLQGVGTGTTGYYPVWLTTRTLGIGRLQHNTVNGLVEIAGLTTDTKYALVCGLLHSSYARRAVVGYTGSAAALYGEALSGVGVFGSSVTGIAIQAIATGAQPAVDATCSGSGAGLYGYNTGSGYGAVAYVSGTGGALLVQINRTGATAVAAEILSTSSGTTLKVTNSSTGALARFFAGTTEYFTILNSGAVGVNLASPSYRLDIYEAGTLGALQAKIAGSSGIAGRFEITSSSNASDCVYAQTAGNGTAMHGKCNGTGDGIWGEATAASKSGGYFTNSNASGYGAYAKNTSHNTFVAMCGAQHALEVEAKATNGNCLMLNMGVTGTSSTTAYNLIIGMDGGTRKWRVDRNGKTFQNGGSQSSGADFAELVDVEGTVAAGDVMVVSISTDRTFGKCASVADPKFAGVISTFPGFIGSESGWTDEQLAAKKELAVVGIVPTKVTAAGGSIQRGDLLVTSSELGRAQKAGESPSVGTIIGKALQGHASGTGTILVLLGVR